MSILDEVLRTNAEFVKTYQPIDAPPRRSLAVVACMDYRIPMEKALGLKVGDAYVIRNAGGIVTEDVLRSLLIAHHRLGVQEVLIINHTECGMLTFSDEELLDELERKTGTASVSPEQFHAFRNLTANVRRQIQKLRAHPWMPNTIKVSGLIYDVHTGRLSPVSAQAGDSESASLPALTPLAPLAGLGPDTGSVGS